MPSKNEESSQGAPIRRNHGYLLFELTERCQNDCLFCYNVWKEDEDYPKEELSTQQTISLLDKVIDESGCKYLGLTGGEPLLKPDIVEIASFIASKGVDPVIISNGQLLSKNTVKMCIDSGVKLFEISLHSNVRELHDRLAGRQGNFEEVVDAILNIKDLGGQATTVFVATRENVHTFKDTVEANALMGVRWVLFNRVACGGTCLSNWTDLAPTPDQIRTAIDAAAGVAQKYNVGLSAGVQMQPCLFDLSKYDNVHANLCPLNDPSSDSSYFAIDPAGNLRMCNRSKTILGNLLKEPFQKLAESREVEEFGKAIPDFCRDCKLARVCAGGCKADAVSYYGTLAKPDPYLEMYKDQAQKIY